MSSLVQIFILAVALSMDALSVSIALGIKSKRHSMSEAFRISLFFGIFQALMPAIGYVVGAQLKDRLGDITDWIAALLLIAIAAKMLKEAMDNIDRKSKPLTTSVLIGLAIATSIDALIAGTTIGLIEFPLLVSIVMIGIVTSLICIAGYLAGNSLRRFGGDKFEILGALALIAIAINIVL